MLADDTGTTPYIADKDMSCTGAGIFDDTSGMLVAASKGIGRREDDNTVTSSSRNDRSKP